MNEDYAINAIRRKGYKRNIHIKTPFKAGSLILAVHWRMVIEFGKLNCIQFSSVEKAKVSERARAISWASQKHG